MSNQTSRFSADFQSTSYWNDRANNDHSDAISSSLQPLPDQADVVIIGSGYTGLQAAIQTARSGLSTVILEAEELGYGCSTKNGGQISTSVKPSIRQLTQRYGADIAQAIMQEGQASRDFIQSFIEDEQIECHFKACGRYHAAHGKRPFKTLLKDHSHTPGFEIIQPEQQHNEIGSQAYHGGVLIKQHASLDPRLYFNGLVDKALQAGVTMVSHCKVNHIKRISNGFHLLSPRGGITATQVILATNGYTGELTPWHKRRVIPIGSYVIATEKLPEETMNQLMPHDRIYSDTRKLVYYYRASPDRRRIIFGGRVSLQETDTKLSALKLHNEMSRLFPQVAKTKISYSWMGYVAFSFDTLMHTGHDRGLHYSLGYCGSGVGMASYLGMRIGQRAAGLRQQASAFDEIPFQTRPLYNGHPWFLAPSILAYRFQDWLSSL